MTILPAARRLLARILRWAAYPPWQDPALDIAERLDPWLPVRTEQEWALSAEGIRAGAMLQAAHPCLACGGHGAVVVSGGSDVAVCPVCRGAKVDPGALAR